ncbi:hypothetical protein ACHAPO_007649 [Fusarium lateritium]
MATHDSPATLNNVTPADSTWWPPLRTALLSGELKPEDLKIDCAICLERCTVLGREVKEHGLTHTAVILPCGHILGHSCINKHLWHLLKKEGKARCPFCREKFHHTECGHICSVYSIPLDEELTKTIPEILGRGGSISTKCHECWLRGLAENLKRTIRKPYGSCTFRDQLEISVMTKKSAYCTRENDDDDHFQPVRVPLEYFNHLNSAIADFHRRQWDSHGRTIIRMEIWKPKRPN